MTRPVSTAADPSVRYATHRGARTSWIRWRNVSGDGQELFSGELGFSAAGSGYTSLHKHLGKQLEPSLRTQRLRERAIHRCWWIQAGRLPHPGVHWAEPGERAGGPGQSIAAVRAGRGPAADLRH